MKTVIFISIISSLLGSCSGSKFISRKYTAGIFRQHQGAIKHNTLFVDSTKLYTAINPKIEFKRLELPINKAIEENITIKSSVKKDSAFVFQRKGKDQSYVKRCTGKHVMVIFDSEKNIIKIRPIEKVHSHIREKEKSPFGNPACSRRHAIIATILSLILWIIPIVGIITSVVAIQKIKIAKENNQIFNFNTLDILKGITLFLSILMTIAFFVFLFYAFALFISSAVFFYF